MLRPPWAPWVSRGLGWTRRRWVIHSAALGFGATHMSSAELYRGYVVASLSRQAEHQACRFHFALPSYGCRSTTERRWLGAATLRATPPCGPGLHTLTRRDRDRRPVAVIRCDTGTTMHLERVGGRFVAAVLLLAVASNAAFAQDRTYRCTVADVAWLDDDGRLRPDSNPKDMLRRLYDGVIIDTLTGAVTFPDGGREVWNVVRPGTSENDYVLTRQTAPGLSSDQRSRTRDHPHPGLERSRNRCGFWRFF